MTATTTSNWRGLAVLVLLNAVAPMVMVGLALSEEAIARTLHLSLREEVLLLERLVLALLVVTLLSGPLMARLGIARLLRFSVLGAVVVLLLIVTQASWLTNALEIRVLAFLLGAFVAPLSPATQVLAAAMEPQEARARRLTLWNGARTGGMLAGALLAGVLLEHGGWGAVFLLPLAVLLSALLLLPGLPPTAVAPAAFDQRGLLLLLGWLVPLALLQAFGLPSWAVLHGLTVAVGIALMMTVFVLHVLRAPEPLVRLDVLRLPGVTFALLLVFLLNVATTGEYEMLFVQQVLGWSPRTVSWYALAYPFGQLIGVAMSSLLRPRMAGSALECLGLTLLIAGMVGFSRLGPDVDTLATVTPRILTGLGSGLVLPLLSVIAFRQTPAERQTDVSSLLVFLYLFGTEAGLDGLSTVYGTFADGLREAGFHAVFVTEIGIAAACLLMALARALRPRRESSA